MTNFRYENQGRRPLTIISLVLVLFIGAITIDADMLADPAGPWVSGLWLLCALGLGWMVIANPKSGFCVSETGIDWWNGSRTGSVPARMLDRFEIRDWTDSTDYKLVLNDGSEVALQALSDVDREGLAKVLADNNIGFVIR